MVIYYVDVENVGNEWMNIIKDETPNDKILYLFTSKYAHLTYSEAAFLHDYMSLGVVYIKEGWSCGGGSNAIDYYLMGTMNNDIITDENAEENEYIILSDDKGYDAFIRELKEKGINIRRQPKGEKDILEKIKKEKALETLSRKEQDEIKEKNKLECETRIEKKLRDTVQSQFTKKKSHIREYPYKQIAVCFYKTKNFENAVQKIKSETERKIFCSLITKKVRKEILKDIENSIPAFL